MMIKSASLRIFLLSVTVVVFTQSLNGRVYREVISEYEFYEDYFIYITWKGPDNDEEGTERLKTPISHQYPSCVNIKSTRTRYLDTKQVSMLKYLYAKKYQTKFWYIE